MIAGCTCHLGGGENGNGGGELVGAPVGAELGAIEAGVGGSVTLLVSVGDDENTAPASKNRVGAAVGGAVFVGAAV